jgi:uncharacterized protein (DUF2141 family)
VTDDEGRFSFVALPAGRFTLTASKAGYVNMTYGAKQAGRAGTPIQLIEGQKIDKATITLPRGSVVTGYVVDDHGEPAPGTQVRVMRFMMRTGERALQSAGTDLTDDRGLYRIYGLQPGDYVVSAMPRNQSIGAVREVVMAEVEALMQQAQAMGVGGGGRGGVALGGGGRGQDLMNRAAALQAQLEQDDAQAVAYAPVYYPGTTVAGSAQSVTLGVGDERAGIDFQLQLVQTAKIEGIIAGHDGTLPQGVQISLVPADQDDMPRVPGVNNMTTRPNADGSFALSNITPGQYRLMARATVRDVSADAEAPVPPALGRGRGGRGNFGQVSEVLWAAQDVSVAGQNLSNVVLQLQPGMKVSGRFAFEGAQAPEDVTRARVSMMARGDEMVGGRGGIPPATVDASWQFTIPGVAPGRYSVSASAGGGRGRGQGDMTTQASTTSWTLKSAVVNGVDVLDFPISVEPNQDVNGMLLTFTSQTQEISGSIQDATGRPTSDFTIVVYPADRRYWTPQSRRIAATRPDTEGRFTIRGLPAGNYQLTAVTDAETGEWYNPEFLDQLVGASIPISLAEGEKKTQDVRVAGGG